MSAWREWYVTGTKTYPARFRNACDIANSEIRKKHIVVSGENYQQLMPYLLGNPDSFILSNNTHTLMREFMIVQKW